MAVQKIYAGAKLREIRTRLTLTQRGFAEKLGVSLPYMNQMENNARPVSTTVVLGLAREFGLDVTELGHSDGERLVSDMGEALSDPVFPDRPQTADLRLVASNAPGLARAFLNLHRAYRESQERLASLDAALGEDGDGARSPWEDVRDFFHYQDNYIDDVDRAAEQFSNSLDPGDGARGLRDALDQAGVTLRFEQGKALRHYDAATKVLTISSDAPEATQSFQILLQLALLRKTDLLDAALAAAPLTSDAARDIARIGLANYFAGAALLPYGRFLADATDMRHDLERLAAHYGASIEQVAHRLSTLQRPGAKGIPFFFVRVDQAGTITKRHSATKLQFARFGGACPLWNVHRAFETPGRFLRQLAETPDGRRYVSLAREVSRPGGYFGAPVRRFAIALGCEIRFAPSLVYADDLDTRTPAAFEPIGVSCRICERRDCHQRSVPPLERRLKVTPDHRGILPYEVE